MKPLARVNERKTIGEPATVAVGYIVYGSVVIYTSPRAGVHETARARSTGEWA